TMGAPVNQTISGGTGWIDFLSGSNKLIASIQPNNQNLGSTDVQAYINTAPVRYYNGQYYHDRNITIKPANIALADSVTVRFYFLDSETEKLIAANGCPGCTKPKMAYDLGVSKYSDPNDAIEDGSVLNDNPGLGWLFINASKAAKVPFDKGYYAEFKVKNFSEFWLNNGGFDNNHPLPVQLLTFNANKANNQKDVIANWTTGSEISVNRFEIELAKGNDELRRNNFIKIGELQSRGNTGQGAEYNFTDVELNKSGARYYRLKIIDNDGSFTYSAVRSVVFNSDVKWQVYPNPSNGLFGLLYQLNDGERMKVRVFDAAGKMVYQNNFVANGFVQRTDIDMRAVVFAPGLYLLEAESESGKQSFKLLKQ
ncbi:MAG TPA: T9SS type A sorting domain-containing protein, partial [Chitinophagaceae bacterium]|nr:T9SS type A sorting domain-containing protein [Chitinophagaceae bacterium]